MTLKQQLKTTQILALVIGIVLMMFMLAMTQRIKQLEKTQSDSYVRIQQEISNLNKHVGHAGG